jgi:hypothetical protein
VKKAATATPGTAQGEGGGDGQDGAGEGRQRQQVGGDLTYDRCPHDHQGGAQAGARGHAEQVRVSQGVGKSALVGRAGDGQHGPHEPAQHHPGHAPLPHHDDPGGRKPRVEVDQGEPAQDLCQDGAGRQTGRPHQDADYGRGQEETGAENDMANGQARRT